MPESRHRFTAEGSVILDDGSSLSSWTALFALILLNAIITLAYVALKNIRPNFMREQAEAGNARARRVLDLTADFTRLQLTSQFTITLITFAIAAVAALGPAQWLVSNTSMNPLVDYILVLLPTALATLILGNLLPAAIASGRADSLALAVVIPMRLLLVVLKPVVMSITILSQTLSRTFGGDDIREAITEEEIMTMVDAGQKGGAIEDEEKEMIYSVLQFGETLAREVMVPRIDVVALDMDTPLTEAVTTFIESGHSRLPVYDGSIDNVKGLLYAKDVLRVLQYGGQKAIGELLRPVYFVPETKQADVLLNELQQRKVHMALVVDEYGGTAGLVTIEDLLEEIVGDIRDEYDIHEEAEYVQHNPDEFTVDASMNLEDFNELLGTELTTEDSDTLGGYLYSHFGRVPVVGETVEFGDLLLRVEGVEGQRIRKIHAARRKAESGGEAAAGSETPQPETVTD